MSDQPTPPPPPPPDPPSEAPPGTPAAPPSSTAGTGASPDRGPMIVLSYLWLLALVPFLIEKEDEEVKWHARHGLVLFGAELILMVVLSFLMSVPAVGCLMVPVAMLFGLGFMGLHIVCIAKGLSGERFTVPYVSEYADRF